MKEERLVDKSGGLDLIRDAQETVARLGRKHAEVLLLERQKKEIDARLGKLRSEIVLMEVHAANAAAMLLT